MTDETRCNETVEKLDQFAKTISCGIVSYTEKETNDESCIVSGDVEELTYHIAKIIYLVCREKEVKLPYFLANLIAGVETFNLIAEKKPHLFENKKPQNK